MCSAVSACMSFFRLECVGKVSGCHAEQTHKHTDNHNIETTETKEHNT